MGTSKSKAGKARGKARKAKNFGCLPEKYSSYKDSGIVILPVPYDGTSTWIKGADKGPAAIIDASENLELYDIATDSEVFENGIFTDKPISRQTSPEKMADAVAKRVDYHIANGKFVVTLGGEHSVSIGSVAAHKVRHGDICVLQLDAHADLRQEYLGSGFNHACVMARIKERCPVVQVGIRSMSAEEKGAFERDRMFFAWDIHANKGWVHDAVSKISKNVYITIDLDVFDPSEMPSTGTPEPGGLSWHDVMALLKAVNDAKNIIGFDVVELCPQKENRAPDFLAAKLIYELLSRKFGPGEKKDGVDGKK